MTQKLDLELVQGLWAFLDQLVFVKSFFCLFKSDLEGD